MIVLVGGGGHATDVAELAARSGVSFVGYVADPAVVSDQLSVRGIQLLGGLDEIPSNASILLGIGYPKAKTDVAKRLVNGPTGPLIDPSAVVASTATIGQGAQLFWQSALSPSVQLGSHALISYASTVGHDSTIGDFTSVMPGARISGNVTIGSGVLVGTGATVLQGLSIGNNASIGAGAVVISDVASGDTVVGVPAKSVGKVRS